MEGCLTALALLLCVLPESLELAVSISLMRQMRAKTSLVTNMAASEKIGGTQELLITKSGVLTENRKSSKIRSFYLNQEHI